MGASRPASSPLAILHRVHEVSPSVLPIIIICITVVTDEDVVAIFSEVNDRVIEPLNSCFLTLGWYVFIITFFVVTNPYVAITKWAEALGFVPHANPIRIIDIAPSWLWVGACTSDETIVIMMHHRIESVRNYPE